MGKILRVELPDHEWEQFKGCLSHHGEISFILRQAIKNYIIAKRVEQGMVQKPQERKEIVQDGNGDTQTSPRRRSTKIQVDRNR